LDREKSVILVFLYLCAVSDIIRHRNIYCHCSYSIYALCV